MTIAFDAKSESGQTTADMNFTHTPVGTPRGVILRVVQRSNFTNQAVSAPTYGGVAMTAAPLSLLQINQGVLDAAIYCWFLGSNIPTGAQNVVIDWNATASLKCALCITVTAAGNTEIEDTSTLNSAGVADPSVVVSVGASINAFIAAALWSSHADFASLAVGSGFTRDTVADNEFGASGPVFDFMHRTANFDGPGDATVNWTATSAEAGLFAIAIKEIAAVGGGGTRARRRLNPGLN